MVITLYSSIIYEVYEVGLGKSDLLCFHPGFALMVKGSTREDVCQFAIIKVHDEIIKVKRFCIFGTLLVIVFKLLASAGQQMI